MESRAINMDTAKRKRLEAKGWKVGNTTEFLELTPEENAFIELKLALSKHLKELRTSQNFSQEELAKKVKSSQSRIAKMEACDPSVSLDLIIKTILSLGSRQAGVIN
jgi:DNA-binding XRE family transcriptional regulator